MVQNELEHPDPIIMDNITRLSLFPWFIWRESLMKFLPLLQPLKNSKKPLKTKKKPKQKKTKQTKNSHKIKNLACKLSETGRIVGILTKKLITFGNLNSKTTMKTVTCLWLRTLSKTTLAKNIKVEKEKGNKMVKEKNLDPGDTITSALGKNITFFKIRYHFLNNSFFYPDSFSVQDVHCQNYPIFQSFWWEKILCYNESNNLISSICNGPRML